jgi:hypothetical protein
LIFSHIAKVSVGATASEDLDGVQVHANSFKKTKCCSYHKQIPGILEAMDKLQIKGPKTISTSFPFAKWSLFHLCSISLCSPIFCQRFTIPPRDEISATISVSN